ncbi:phage holin family protein [Candidatus Mycosynbacter amalyticus]|uniref:Phage holin family protein n=1 Tax=Candidatus Mycosynbacter amalyticus TaxID=2665156 RepID=A0A857MUF3_9BACT|nr:phage holin family protein [Candidatus Mycosynbacter amalyticus]QHN43027.1 phage holin family protein [Candidatus Mycosynbacter amalyticus]
MRRQFAVFIVRWLLNSFGLWVAVRLLGTGVSDQQIDESIWLFLLAGLVFSILNTLLRPVVIILSLPAILVTLGLFIFIVNGFVVWLAIQLTPGLEMTFLNSIFAGMLLSLINYIVSSALELQVIKKREEA